MHAFHWCVWILQLATFSLMITTIVTKRKAAMTSSVGAVKEKGSAKKVAATTPGDIMLGGLSPVHKKSTKVLKPCGEIQEDRGKVIIL